jgi:hypothetical protein
VRRSNEVEAQRPRWTFYETIKFGIHTKPMNMAGIKTANNIFPACKKGNRMAGSRAESF